MKQEDIDKYLLKSGDDRIYTTNLIENEHGFCSYRIEQDILYLINVYGNGQYWETHMMDIARQNCCTKVRTTTRRDPLAYVKKYGARIIGYVLEREVG